MAKLLGTLVTVGGAMYMTLVKGHVLNLPWTRRENQHFPSKSEGNEHDIIMSALAITVSCFCWSCFITLQVRRVGFFFFFLKFQWNLPIFKALY